MLNELKLYKLYNQLLTLVLSRSISRSAASSSTALRHILGSSAFLAGAKRTAAVTNNQGPLQISEIPNAMSCYIYSNPQNL